MGHEEKVWDPNKWNSENAGNYSGPKIVFWNNLKTGNGTSTCPFAQRPWIALLEKKLPFTEICVDLMDKPDDFKGIYASIQPDPTARAKVPILEVGEPGSPDYLKLLESGVIVDFINDQWRDSGEALHGKTPALEAKMRFFSQCFQETMSSGPGSITMKKTKEEIMECFTKVMNGLYSVDKALALGGLQTGKEAPFFLGAQYSVAEAMTAPFVMRLQYNFKIHRDIDLLQTMSKLGLMRVRTWWEAVAARESTRLTTPAMEQFENLPAYVKPTFLPCKLTGEEQQGLIDACLKLWGDMPAPQERKF